MSKSILFIPFLLCCVFSSLKAQTLSAQFGYSDSFLGVQFSDSSSGNPGTWHWDFGDGNTSSQTNPQHIYASAGTYQVCLAVSDSSGTDTLCKSVAVCDTIEGGFGFSIIFYDDFTGAFDVSLSDSSSGTITQTWYYWENSPNPSSYDTTAGGIWIGWILFGNQVFCQEVSNQCTTLTECDSAFVSCQNSIPAVLYQTAATYSSPSTPWIVELNASSNDNVNCWTWSGDLPSTFPYTGYPGYSGVTYTSPGTKIICAQFGCGGCVASSTQSACDTIFIPCVGAMQTDTFHFQVSGDTVHFSDPKTYQLGAYSRVWNFGDGSTDTSANPVHVYTQAGSYLVCLSQTNECGTDNFCQTIEITCPPAASGFSAQPNFNSVAFQNTSGGTASSFYWDFGDGNSSTQFQPTHTYTSPGTYQICLIATDSCGSDTNCQALTVSCPPISAGFNFQATGNTATFNNQSSGNGLTYHWDFGDGNTSNQSQPTHTYASPGNYTACLIASDSCSSDTLCLNLTIVGRENPAIPNLKIFPNPAREQVHLEFPWVADWEIILFDPTGRKVGEQWVRGMQTTSFSTGELSPGVYQLRVRSGKRQVLTRLLIHP